MSRNFKLLTGAAASAFMLTACSASHAAPNTAANLDGSEAVKAEQSEKHVRRFVIKNEGADVNCEVIISTSTDKGDAAGFDEDDTQSAAHDALSQMVFFSQDGDVDCGKEGKLHITIPESFNLNFDHLTFDGEFADEMAELATSLKDMTQGLQKSFKFTTEFTGEDGEKQIVITTSDNVDGEAIEREIERHVVVMERKMAQLERDAENLEKKIQRKIVITQNRAENEKIRQQAYESELRSLEKAREHIEARMTEVEKRIKEAEAKKAETTDGDEK